MNKLDSFYCDLLKVGFIVLRQAVASRNEEWINAELEFLHNIPSLIGEVNVERHRYFWFQERVAYIDWMAANGSADAQSRMRTFYEPIWQEMESSILELTGSEV